MIIRVANVKCELFSLNKEQYSPQQLQKKLTTFFFSKEKERKLEKYETIVNHTINEMRIKS